MEPMEIHIAIVEDEEDHAHYIKSIADKWAAQNRIKIHADMFESAENFKSAQGEGKEFDMVLLDVQMGGQNGIELAKELRKTDDNKPIIIFITAMADLMSEGFEVSALHYLVKPIDADKFCEVLDRAQKSLTQSGGSALFLQTDEGNV
ncbi:MAG: response regulator, partial [Oscillospiraceae bacterium]|nr:response regulator [Oscillospiraceae bacterium]